MGMMVVVVVMMMMILAAVGVTTCEVVPAIWRHLVFAKLFSSDRLFSSGRHCLCLHLSFNLALDL